MTSFDASLALDDAPDTSLITSRMSNENQCIAPYTNHIASKGEGVKVMYMFVYIGGSGGLANVYVAFFAPNFSRISI